jgi:hypothetical protein
MTRAGRPPVTSAASGSATTLLGCLCHLCRSADRRPRFAGMAEAAEAVKKRRSTRSFSPGSRKRPASRRPDAEDPRNDGAQIRSILRKICFK